MAASNVWDMGGTSQPAAPTPAPTTPSNQGGGWGGGNIFYNGGNYGQSQDWYNSPIGQNIREGNQGLAFASWANRLGVGNTDNTFSRWLNTTQKPRFAEAYGMASMDNPMLTIDQFLSTMPNYTQLQQEYNSLSPLARGTNIPNYAPAVRWVPR
jgi:hypothetical protein